jgi:hypothetical protein
MLDPVQYYNDMKDGLQCYEKINLLVRRNPKENNNKAVLSSIRDLMSTTPESGLKIFFLVTVNLILLITG